MSSFLDKFWMSDLDRPRPDTAPQNPAVRLLPRTLADAVEAADMGRPEIEPVEKQASMDQVPAARAEAPTTEDPRPDAIAPDNRPTVNLFGSFNVPDPKVTPVEVKPVAQAPSASAEAPAADVRRAVADRVPVPQDKKVEDMTAQEMKDFRFPFRDPAGKEPVPPGYVAADGYEPKSQEVEWPEHQPTPQTMEEWKAFRFPTRSENTLAAAARAAGMTTKEDEDDQDTGRSEGVGGRSQVHPTSYSDSNAIAGVSGVMGLAGGQADESPDRHPTPNGAPTPTPIEDPLEALRRALDAPDANEPATPSQKPNLPRSLGEAAALMAPASAPSEDPLDALHRALDAPEPERPAAPSQTANFPRSLGESAARMASTPTPSEDPLDALHRALDAPDANEPVPRPEISRARRMRP